MIDSYSLLRHWLFCLDPEKAHHLTLTNLDRAQRWGLLERVVSKPIRDQQTLCGINFPNPVGLAAGLDKDGKHIDALAALGFGFLEIGTVTPLPQPGNPKPRMFRLPQAQALINRMGFNNDGVEACVHRVRQSQFWQNGGVLGLNIGKNASTPIEEASKDYIIAMEAVYEIASYITVNISSPNTKNLCDLHGEEKLRDLLGSLDQERKFLSDRHGVRKPLFLKIAPDLDHDDIHLITDLMLEYGIDAVIATNTTISREAVHGIEYANEAGGLSGAPVREASNRVIKALKARVSDQLPIIGVGGIMTGADAREKIMDGASLVQLYSGLIYRGTDLVNECARTLRQA